MSASSHFSTKPKLDKSCVVVRFAGDSGDGIQLTGERFSSASARHGNDLVTFPDYPAEIRAPAGTIEGVSGYQVQIGSVAIHTSGDQADVLVAFNPAALRANLRHVAQGGIIIVNIDAFSRSSLAKAGYQSNPLDDGTLSSYHLVDVTIETLTKEAVKDRKLQSKHVSQCKNMFALGITHWLFTLPLQGVEQYIDAKFSANNDMVWANKKALHAGYYYAETLELLPSSYHVPAARVSKGTYRHLSGTTAIAWGLMAAAKRMSKKLFYASYPITPASNILHELAKHGRSGVTTLQAEDEIASVCAALGASYAGQLGATASSGPGIVLKGETIGLAVMAELPLVVVDVQRGGPSTGLPTKTEQADLYLSMYGRNSESPVVVLAASTPSDAFEMAYMAAKITVEHMTPVILLADAHLANGSEPWRIPLLSDMPAIRVPTAVYDGTPHRPYQRDDRTLARYWAIPGMPHLEHRIGGLEKQDETGHVSYDPDNHEKMVRLRAAKVARVADYISPWLLNKKKKKLLVVGWGGTYGSLHVAAKALANEGYSIEHRHFQYIHPLPPNTEAMLCQYETITVCELNTGQFASYLRSQFSGIRIETYTKIQGLPFMVAELRKFFLQYLKP